MATVSEKKNVTGKAGVANAQKPKALPKPPKVKAAPAPKKASGGSRHRTSAAPISPLAPMTPAQLRKQAMETIRAIYKPAFKQLGREEKRLMSISEKRKTDNQYYLTWLDGQSKQLQAHTEAANQGLLAAGKEAAADVNQGYEDLRQQLLATGQNTPGVVSNPGEANAFDVSGQAQRDRELVEAARSKTQSQIGSTNADAAMAGANNFALIAASEAQRVGDQWKGLSELGDSKTKLRLSKAADAAKEVSRLLDREIQKAQIRGQIRSAEAQAELEAARFGLDKSKFGLDVKEFNFEQEKSAKKYGLEKRKIHNEERKINETHRYHTAEIELQQAKSHQEKMKASHKITAVIQEGISTIAANPNLKSKLQKNPDAVKRRLMKILGSATAAHAAVELITMGRLTSTTRQDLRQIGYIIPPRWR